MVAEDGDYLKASVWDDIASKQFDVVILNMEDDYEFILTMYLKNSYKDNEKFVNSLINIIHDPINAKLLENKNNNHNIILSEKLVGQYMTQVMFNNGVIDIFEEITSTKGNEFYILDTEEYKALYSLSYIEMKSVLLQNSMLYIGVMRDDKFVVNCPSINNTDKIVILGEGI